MNNEIKITNQMTEEEKLYFFRGYIHAHAEEFAKQFGYTTKEATILILKEFINRKETKQKKEHFDKDGDTQR
ncbi:hypothetical protein ACQKF0_29915 [Bacillus wiedmannii]|uniref:hypothetical protein n=1 Tax=Bacillus wiedmannii TaxID=1890302 RepID=UPI003CFF6695